VQDTRFGNRLKTAGIHHNEGLVSYTPFAVMAVARQTREVSD
jgi:hypothetical protein